MLTHLSIRDIVLIEALDLSVHRGFTAMTGETGAGKSILLDSLGLATGARANAGLVRAGAEEAQVTASFQLTEDHPVYHLLREHHITAETDEPLSCDAACRARGAHAHGSTTRWSASCSCAMLRQPWLKFRGNTSKSG